MLPGLDHLVDRWRADPRPAATLALCQALAEMGEERRRTAHDNVPEWQALLDLSAEVSAKAQESFADDIDILLAVARTNLATSSIFAAQQVLILVLRRAPNDPLAFRLLGEALLRRGDAKRAQKAIGKAVQLGMQDPKTQIWLDRANFYADMQDARGADAVAEEMRRVLGYAAALPAPESQRWTLPPGTLSDAPPPARISVPPSSAAGASSSRASPRGGHVPTLMGIPAVTADDIQAALARLPADVSGAEDVELVGETYESSTDALTVRTMLPDEELPTRKRDVSEFRDQILGGSSDEVADEATTKASRDDVPDSIIEILELAASGALRAAGSPGLGDEYEPETKVHRPAEALLPPDDPATDPAGVPVSHLPAAIIQTLRMNAQPPAPPSDDPATARLLVGLTEESVASQNPPRAHELPVTRIEPPASVGRPAPPAPAAPAPAAPAAAPPAARAPRPARRPRRWLLWGVALLLIVAGGAVGGWQWWARQRDAREADRLALEAESVLAQGGEAAIDAAAQKLIDARTLDPERPDVVDAYLHFATIELLDYRGDEKRAVAIVDEARRLGARGPSLAAVSVAAAVATQNEPLASSLVEQSDKSNENLESAYYQVAAGAALELRGDPSAGERYDRALERAPDLHSARHRLARVLLLGGEVDRGREVADTLGETRPIDRDLLLALASTISGGADREARFPSDQVPTLPRTLRALGVSLAEVDDGASELAAAIPWQASPFVLLFVGERALDRGQWEVARAASERAALLAPSLGRARVLAARVAIAEGRPADAARQLDGQTGPEALSWLAIAAYELCDLPGLRGALAELGTAASPPLSMGMARLQGQRPLSDEALASLDASQPWATIVTIDALLDRGERDRAKAALAQIEAAASHPVYAVRAARLARETGDLESAKRAISSAPPARASSREAFFIATSGDEASPESADQALKETGPERAWLHAYALAQNGETKAAGAEVEALELPEDADLELRVTAALALAHAGDVKRGRKVATSLLDVFPRRYDAIRAGVELGILPPGALPRADSAPASNSSQSD